MGLRSEDDDWLVEIVEWLSGGSALEWQDIVDDFPGVKEGKQVLGGGLLEVAMGSSIPTLVNNIASIDIFNSMSLKHLIFIYMDVLCSLFFLPGLVGTTPQVQLWFSLRLKLKSD